MRLLFPPTKRPTKTIFDRAGLTVYEQPFYTTTDIKVCCLSYCMSELGLYHLCICFIMRQVRMSLIRNLKGNSVAIYSPIAATPACVETVREKLGSKGTVSYIIMQVS
jgi:hypothetical protein